MSIDRKIKNSLISSLRIIIPAGLTIVLFFSAIYNFAIPTLRENLLENKREVIRELTNVTYTLLDGYHKRVLNGELTLEEAQIRAIERIKKLRYGSENKDYFWINDLHPNMIMHPYRTDLNGTDISNFKDPNGKRLFVDMVETVRENNGEGFVEYMWQWKDDSSKIVPKVSFVKLFEPWDWVIGTGIYIEDVNQKISSATLTLRNVSTGILILAFFLTVITSYQGYRSEKEREQSEYALIQSEEKYRTLFEDSRDAIYVRSVEGVILDCNKAMADLFGYKRDDMLGINIKEFYTRKQDYEKFKIDLNKNGYVREYPLRLMRRDGKIIETLITTSIKKTSDGSGFIYQGIVRDITEKIKLENQLQQSQKMEAVGQLAGGVAHDFNNMLTAITGKAELALLEVNEDDPIHQDFNEILETAWKAADLTRQLLAFSRQQVIAPKIINLNSIIHNMARMLQRIISEEIELVTNVTEGLWNTKVDPTQFEQVILNLVVNARDAMPEGGKLILSTENLSIEKGDIRHSGNINSGDWVLFSVQDTGKGINKHIQDHIFEPFFTTKEKGKGTGLGLSTVYGIVKQSKGDIEVISEKEFGTIFRIYLPRIRNSEISDTKNIKNESKVDDYRGAESVFVIEDDPMVHSISVKSLKRGGYTVFDAHNGDEALKKIKSMESPVDIVLSDVIMPGVSGIKLLNEIKSIWPDVKFVFMSGYTDNEEIQEIISSSQIPFIQKPFGPADLTKKIREVLDMEKSSIVRL